MLDNCVLVGDSIAVGIAPYTKCEIQAKIGRSAASAYANSWQLNASTTIISLGSNDINDPNLESILQKLRKDVTSEVVIWVVPYNPKVAQIVLKIAKANRDSYINLQAFPTADGVHPKNYRAVTDTVEKVYQGTF